MQRVNPSLHTGMLAPNCNCSLLLEISFAIHFDNLKIFCMKLLAVQNYSLLSQFFVTAEKESTNATLGT